MLPSPWLLSPPRGSVHQEHALLGCCSTPEALFRQLQVVPHNDPTLLFTNAGMNQVSARSPEEERIMTYE